MEIEDRRMATVMEKILREKSRRLLLAVFRIAGMFPKQPLNGLANRMQNNCVAILADIIRGCNRGKNDDAGHFFRLSIGSLIELKHNLQSAHQLKVLNDSDFHCLIEETDEIMRLLTSSIRPLNLSIKNGSPNNRTKIKGERS